ncbi:MAG: hypothetical protein LBV14_15365 [Acidovorax sp.]|jgi:hypothetical protein|nr:hypothetical protein [Acidovorax sp.]
MSGPKVVRVVTREELLAQSQTLLAQSQTLLARMDQAQAHWLKSVAAEDGDARAQAAARREQLLALLASDAFARFNAAAEREITFLHDDAERRHEQAAMQRAQRNAMRMRSRQNAQVLLQALHEKGVALQAGMQQSLDAVAQGEATDAAAQQALAAGFQMLTPAPQPAALSSAQMALAQRLAADSDKGSDEGSEPWKRLWLDEQVDARLHSITRQLERLRQLTQGWIGQGPFVATFEQRIASAIAEPGQARRSMLLDSLQLELASAAQDAKAFAALHQEAQALLDAWPAASQDMRAELQSVLEARQLAALQQWLDSARAEQQAAVQAEAAQHRRAAVLKGLAALGYAVHEGMETAWLEQGRIVVQKPGQSDYGVELAAAPAAQRMQVRSVAFQAERDASRDLDAEQLWCSDFTRLQSQLASEGGQLVVEKALGVGASPLKQVQQQDVAQAGRASQAHTQSRGI